MCVQYALITSGFPMKSLESYSGSGSSSCPLIPLRTISIASSSDFASMVYSWMMLHGCSVVTVNFIFVGMLSLLDGCMLFCPVDCSIVILVFFVCGIGARFGPFTITMSFSVCFSFHYYYLKYYQDLSLPYYR